MKSMCGSMDKSVNPSNTNLREVSVDPPSILPGQLYPIDQGACYGWYEPGTRGWALRLGRTTSYFLITLTDIVSQFS